MAILIRSQEEIIFCLRSAAADSQCMPSEADTSGTIIQTKLFIYKKKNNEEIANFKREKNYITCPFMAPGTAGVPVKHGVLTAAKTPSNADSSLLGFDTPS